MQKRIDKTKCCNTCKTTLPLSEFYKRSSGSLRPRCKSCTVAYNQKRRHKKPMTVRYEGCMKRAKMRNLDLDITPDYLESIQTKHCPISGVELDYSIVARYEKHNNSAELDRIDNSKGYVKGNVVFISRKYNRIKGEGSIEDFEMILKFLRSKANE